MAPVAVLLSTIQYLHCSHAAWPYEYSATEWIGMPATRTPESQWGTGSTPFAGLCLQTDAHPQNTGRHPCLIATNRTPCRRSQRSRLQKHSHGLQLHKESAHSCRGPCQCYRTWSYKSTATAHASERTTLPDRGTQHSWHKKVSVQPSSEYKT